MSVEEKVVMSVVKKVGIVLHLCLEIYILKIQNLLVWFERGALFHYEAWSMKACKLGSVISEYKYIYFFIKHFMSLKTHYYSFRILITDNSFRLFAILSRVDNSTGSGSSDGDEKIRKNKKQVFIIITRVMIIHTVYLCFLTVWYGTCKWLC